MTATTEDQRRGRPSTMLMWMSYRNHVVHSSIYVAVIAHFVNLLLPLWTGAAAMTTMMTATTTDEGRDSSLSQSLVMDPWLCGCYCLAIALTILCLATEVSYAWKTRRLPPGDSGWPLVGHIPMFFLDPVAFHEKMHEKYGPRYTLNSFMQPIVQLIDEDDCSWLMTQERKSPPLVKPLALPHIKLLVGNEAVMVLAGKKHRHLRRLLEPFFSPRAIRNYVDLIDRTVQGELRKWCSTGDFVPPKAWAILAMRLFFVCTVGGDIDEERLDTLNRLFATWVRGATTSMPFSLPGSPLRRALQAKQDLHGLLSEMIVKFKEENPPGSDGAQRSLLGNLCYNVDAENHNNDEEEDNDGGNSLSEAQLINNLLFLLFAGHDTMKGSFGSITVFLTQNPTICDLLVEEVSTVFPGPHESLDIDELRMAAPLLNAFLAETWRMFSPLPGHNVETITELTYGGYRIPPRTGVTMTLQSYHMADRYFRSAREFRLERWIPPGHPMHDPSWYKADVDYNAMSVKYRPFNAGPHMCLGSHFAKLEARVVLTRLLQTYHVKVRNAHLTRFPLLQWQSEFQLHERERTKPHAAATTTPTNDCNGIQHE